jgi:hypothetical protein
VIESILDNIKQPQTMGEAPDLKPINLMNVDNVDNPGGGEENNFLPTLEDVDGAKNKIDNRLLGGGTYDNRKNMFYSTNDPNTHLTIREQLALIQALNNKSVNVDKSLTKLYSYANEIPEPSQPFSSKPQNIKPESLVETNYSDENNITYYKSINNSKKNLQLASSALNYYKNQL